MRVSAFAAASIPILRIWEEHVEGHDAPTDGLHASFNERRYGRVLVAGAATENIVRSRRWTDGNRRTPVKSMSSVQGRADQREQHRVPLCDAAGTSAALATRAAAQRNSRSLSPAALRGESRA